MERITITLDDELVQEIDRLAARRGGQNRSEAIRDLARSGLRQAAEESDLDGDCMAALVYAYNHHERQLSQRLAEVFHDHHDLSVAATHVHLDHESCLEVNLLRGQASEVRHLAEHVIAERGVQHGRLVMLPVEVQTRTHAHGAASHSHTHIRVRSGG